MVKRQMKVFEKVRKIIGLLVGVISVIVIAILIKKYKKR
jgi:hypothetical protein